MWEISLSFDFEKLAMGLKQVARIEIYYPKEQGDKIPDAEPPEPKHFLSTRDASIFVLAILVFFFYRIYCIHVEIQARRDRANYSLLSYAAVVFVILFFAEILLFKYGLGWSRKETDIDDYIGNGTNFMMVAHLFTIYVVVVLLYKFKKVAVAIWRSATNFATILGPYVSRIASALNQSSGGSHSHGLGTSTCVEGDLALLQDSVPLTGQV